MSKRDPLIKRDEPIELGFYNRDNYATYADAEKEGAVYSDTRGGGGSFEVSLYGQDGLHDLSAIISTLVACIGLDEDFTAAIKTDSGFVDLDTALASFE